MYINDKLVVAVWPGFGFKGKKYHLFFNHERHKGALCGFRVRWWQNPNLSLRSLSSYTKQEQGRWICRHCQIRLLKLLNRWVCCECGGPANDFYSTLERPLCRECWDRGRMLAEAMEEARATW